MTVHGCAVRSPLTCCQVISRPRDRVSRYSKWLNTLPTSLLIRWRGKIDNQNETFVFHCFQSCISSILQKVWCQNFCFRERCFLGNFLRVVCHCFPPPLEVPTFAARCLHVRNDAKDPSSERWNYGRERLSGNFAYMASLFTPLGIFYMPQIYDMGPTVLLPLRRKAC